MMKANNLTISINAKCNRDCYFCISKMTWQPEPNTTLFLNNMRKARTIAKAAQVSSVLVTSKGEPLMNLQQIEQVANRFKMFPLELQTNGSLLNKQMIKHLHFLGFDVIAISISSMIQVENVSEVVEHIINSGMVVRFTVVLTDNLMDTIFPRWLQICDELGVQQLTFRKTTIPTNPTGEESKRVSGWIKENTTYDFKDFFADINMASKNSNLVRRLPWGTSVYAIKGVAVTVINYCIQESNNHEDIRSLIYHCDGHLYTSWDKPESIIF